MPRAEPKNAGGSWAIRDTGRFCPLERVEQQVSFGNESPRGGGDRRWDKDGGGREGGGKRKLDDDVEGEMRKRKAWKFLISSWVVIDMGRPPPPWKSQAI